MRRLTTVYFVGYLALLACSNAFGAYDYVIGSGAEWGPNSTFSNPTEACSAYKEAKGLNGTIRPQNDFDGSESCGDNLGICEKAPGTDWRYWHYGSGMTAGCCPVDTYWNGNECIPIVECESNVNPITGECGDCPSGRYFEEDHVGYDALAGDCLPEIDECIEDGGMIYADRSVEVFGAHDYVVDCTLPPENGCANVTGKLKFNEFDYCQERAQECEQAGGTYGAVGWGNDDVAHVCLKDYADTHECASGSAYWIPDDPLTDSSGFSCVPTDTPNDVCDATKYDCDGDGNIDDQDSDGVKDNGTANENEDGVSLDENGEPIDDVAGDDPLDPATEGAGDCDPTSTNYAECSGQLSADEVLDEVGDGDAADMQGQADNAANDAIDSVSDAFEEALGDGDSGISGATGIGNSLSSGGFIVPGCSDVSFNWKGHPIAITCTDTQPLRDVLAWVAYLLTFISVFNIVMKQTPDKV